MTANNSNEGETSACARDYLAKRAIVPRPHSSHLNETDIAQFVPRIGGISTREINLPTFFMYTGWLGYNQTQSCTVLSGVAAGFFVQYYLRNYRPRIFKDFQYLVTAGFDGASLFVVFILSFAVLGAGGPSIPFPTWWGNPNTDTTFIDHCPQPS